MSNHSKMVWSEGMFLKAQHFQQQDRYVERLVRQRTDAMAPYAWGLRSLVLNRELLGLGKLALDRCEGVFEDGTPFCVPEDDPHPAPLIPPIALTNSIVYLCVPLVLRGAPEVDMGGQIQSTARYRAEDQEVMDAIAGSQAVAQVRTARLRLSLMLEHEDRAGFQCLGIARIAEVTADQRIILDPDYIEPCLNASVSKVLTGALTEVTAMLRHRGQALAPRVSGSSGHAVAEIADFLMLQMINRVEPELVHLASIKTLHPERLFCSFLALAGELSTFTAAHKRPMDFPSYRHDDLETPFAAVLNDLRRSLSMVLEQRAVQIPLEDRRYGIRVGTIPDRSLVASAVFVLVVKASLPGETIRRSLPALVKIGPVEQIRELVNVQLPGIRVQPLAVAPRQIPYLAGAVYFELEADSPLWRQMATTGGIAVHLAGDFPDATLALWAIRR
ncbi:type VI secretion system baseplate subunit TssK [Aquabacter sp. L1I39]|uniref:type VI secretion system baseplate subunit TssK n=1 Tax=Aquabacter sp. L1I39 TaxID=2820278 RepID=UPI001AD98712|nr:type VI secretion system baseplate subunit TssK [Aquabacter sp. L1I39]QTL01708.1 type VI secretion system baseplate subunit TssK [Aquabacter sp. L1I39]